MLSRGITVELCTTPIFVNLFHESSTKNSRLGLTTAEVVSLGVIGHINRICITTGILLLLGDGTIHVPKKSLRRIMEGRSSKRLFRTQDRVESFLVREIDQVFALCMIR